MTIKDIARLSGYSVGTVSRVLNNHPDVSKQTRSHVLAVVQANNFQPNTNAKHLKLQNSACIAVLVKGTQNMLFADILERVEAQLRSSGEETMVCYLDENANEVAYAIQLCKEQRPRGLVFLGGNLDNFQADLSIPSVLLTNSARDLDCRNVSSFTTDDAAAASQVIDYLVEHGHRNIALLGGDPNTSQISGSRIRGCLESFRRHGIAFDDKMQFAPCRFSMADGYTAAKELLQNNPGTTAIFALGDVIAIGAMRAIFDLGMKIPEDISLVGFDGIPMSRYCVPRLSTVAQDSPPLAAAGIEDLLKRIHFSCDAVHQVVPFQLVPGESVRRLSAFDSNER